MHLGNGPSSVLTRLLPQALLRLEHMSLRGPRMRSAAGHLVASKVACGGAAVLRCELQLGGGLVVELRRGLERFAQFQTLTSR